VATRSSPTPTRRPWQVVRLFFALLVIAGTVFFGARVLSRYFAISEVPLPNLVGLNVDEAQQTLADLGLTVRTIPSPVSDAPANTVTSQSPGAGSVVREGRSISLEVSTPTNVAVPSLLGSTEAQARTILAQLALELGTITYDFSNEIPAGQIISQNPPPQTEVPVPSNISIAVSRGPNVPTISMPDLRGQNIDAAKNRLRGLGFTSVDTVPSSVSNDSPQTVTQQSPAPKQSVTASTRVTLGYSLSSQIIRQVPNLVGMSLVDAQTTLRNAGLTVGVMSFVTDPAQGSGVVTYSPSQYTLAGSPVMLTINGPVQSLQPDPNQPFSNTPGQLGQTQPGQTQPGQTQPGVVPQGPPAPLGETPVNPEVPNAVPSADGSRDIPFTFDPNQVGITQLISQDYDLSLTVTDAQGERELLSRRVGAGQPVSETLKVYGEATIQMKINGVLFMAWNP
jgi:beta-lactam-binding protein with PASTA domain